MLKIATFSAVLLSACTPGMHHAYQNTMGGVALAGWGTAAYQTHLAMSEPDYTERDPLLGTHPSDTMIMGAWLAAAIGVVALRLIPDDAFDGYTPVIKDVFLTSAAVFAGIDGYGDYSLRH